MRVLVTGSQGMLGRAVVSASATPFQAAGVDIADGDLTLPGVAADLVARHRSDWVVHAAAFTDVDGSESQLERAMAVNGTATERLARACREAGAGLTYISTDYVFDGAADGYDEESPRRPVNAYGRTKAAGEEAVERLADRWQIVRTSWLFGEGPRNFVLTVLRLLSEMPELRIVNDQVGCPTYAPDLADILLFLVRKGQSGYYHATNRGACTWFEFARQIAVLSDADPERVKPCRTVDYPTPARRPACSVLRSRRLEELGLALRPAWQDALARYLRRLNAGAS